MLLKIKTVPNSKIAEIIQKDKNSFIIKIKEKPLQGRANAAALNNLAAFLKIKKEDLRIIKGGKSRSKIIELINRK